MFLSIMGMYEYDNSLFDGLDIPTYTDENGTVHVIDKSTVINNICLECAEMEVVYPDFDTMKLAIGVWSTANQRTWEKLLASMYLTYNPIWNVDATVIIDRDTGRGWSDGGNNTDAVQGFNSATWSNAEKTDYTRSGREDAGEDVTETRQGNIGITSSQQLIEAERSIADFSLINYITQAFKLRFCLLVY